MIPVGYFIMLSDAEHDHFQVVRVESRLSKRFYLAMSCCPEHGEPLGGMVVVDVRMLAERHPEYGPRGVVFATHDELRRYLDPSDADDESHASSPLAVH